MAPEATCLNPPYTFTRPVRTTARLPEPAPTDAGGGSSSAFLDGSEGAEQLSVTLPHEDDADQLIRFKPWADQRKWLLRMLPEIPLGWKKRQRIEACGRNAWVEYSPSHHKVRVVGNFCGSRLCPACRAKRARDIARRLEMLTGQADGFALKLITLTMKHSSDTLLEQMKKLRAWFRRLRSRPLWKNNVTVGVAIAEVSRNEETGHWHPHLHIIALANFISVERLRQQWWRITRNSRIVDIRVVRGTSAVGRYVTSYLTKPPDAKVMASPELVRQWAEAVTSAHWIIPFGKRGALPKPEPQAKILDWVRVAPLDVAVRWSNGSITADLAQQAIYEALNANILAHLDEEPPNYDPFQT